MDVQDASFAGEDTTHSDVRRQALDFIDVGLGRTMIREGDLAGAYRLVHENHILHGAAGQVGHGDPIGPGEYVGGDPFFLKTLGLGVQGFRAAGDAVRTEATNHGGHPALDQTGEGYLRGPGPETALPAAPSQVDMAVDEAWEHILALGIDDLQGDEAAHIELDGIPDAAKLIAYDQDVFYPKVFRRINVAILNDLDQERTSR